MAQLNIKRYNDVGAFLQDTRECLLTEEALNTFVFVTANSLQATKPDPSTYYCSAVWDGTDLVIGAIGLRDDVLFLSALHDPEKMEVAEMLAEEAYASGMNFKHIHGYHPIINQVTSWILKKSENKWKAEEKDAWSYANNKVKWSDRDVELAKYGELQVATAEDTPILRKMAYQFTEDIGEADTTSREDINKSVQEALEALDNNGAYLWVTKEDGPVGMAWVRRPLSKGISISYVAILPEYRHKGYGSVMVSALTEKLLKEYEYVALFALINQNVEDNLYTRVGYRYIGKAGMPKLVR
jgi:ribosomal protein S18 acetylase RimI-like enzyme